MAELNLENIKALFCRITATEQEDFQYNDLIDNAVEKICSLITDDEITDDIASKCEYAVAAQAVYDYTMEKTLCDRVVLTENGGAYRGTKTESDVRSALAFKNATLAELHGHIRDENFLFVTAQEAVKMADETNKTNEEEA